VTGVLQSQDKSMCTEDKLNMNFILRYSSSVAECSMSRWNRFEAYGNRQAVEQNNISLPRATIESPWEQRSNHLNNRFFDSKLAQKWHAISTVYDHPTHGGFRTA
jgi:hypothetical protein